MSQLSDGHEYECCAFFFSQRGEMLKCIRCMVPEPSPPVSPCPSHKACPITLSTGNLLLHGTYYDADALSDYILASGQLRCPHDRDIVLTPGDIEKIDAVSNRNVAKFVETGQHLDRLKSVESEMNERKLTEFLEHEMIEYLEKDDVPSCISVFTDLKSRDEQSARIMQKKMEAHPAYKKYTSSSTQKRGKKQSVREAVVLATESVETQVDAA